MANLQRTDLVNIIKEEMENIPNATALDFIRNVVFTAINDEDSKIRAQMSSALLPYILPKLRPEYNKINLQFSDEELKDRGKMSSAIFAKIANGLISVDIGDQLISMLKTTEDVWEQKAIKERLKELEKLMGSV